LPEFNYTVPYDLEDFIACRDINDVLKFLNKKYPPR